MGEWGWGKEWEETMGKMLEKEVWKRLEKEVEEIGRIKG